jgi:peptidyl-prolyl cis-trans isomerase D
MLHAMREGVGKWIAGAILAFIAVTFIFFGRMDFSGLSATFAAKVNGEEIPILDFERTYQDQQSQYLQAYGIDLSEDLRRTLRANVIESMVNNLALEQRANDMGYRISDARLLDSIRSTTAFQIGGEFSVDAYDMILRGANLTRNSYEESRRQELALRDLQQGIVDSTFYTPAEFRNYIALLNQEREIAYALFEIDSFDDDIEIADEEIADYYEQNGAMFMTPESVDLQYIEILQADVASTVEVEEDDIREYYEERRELYETEEQRSASHILFELDDDDPMAKAEAALARLNAGESFEAVAADVSEDPGTASQGGSLGRIARGMLPGPFEDAVFSMEEGEIRGPVESDFGVHIIRLDAIEAGEVRSFEEVRDELAEQLQRERSEDRFADLAEELDRLAFDANSQLDTVAAALELPLITVNDFPRSGDPEVFENSAAVVQAAFDPTVLTDGWNSRLVELADDDVLVLRVTAHHLPTQEPLEAVRDEIVELLTLAAAEEIAQSAADAFVAEATASEDLAALAQAHGGVWNEPRWVSRTDSSVPTEMLSRIFSWSEPAAEQPRIEAVSLVTGDQAVVRLSAVRNGEPDGVPREERDQRLDEIAEQAALMELAAYARATRDAARVVVPDEVLDPLY